MRCINISACFQGLTVNVNAFLVNSFHLALSTLFSSPSMPRPTTRPSANSKDSSPICEHVDHQPCVGTLCRQKPPCIVAPTRVADLRPKNVLPDSPSCGADTSALRLSATDIPSGQLQIE